MVPDTFFQSKEERRSTWFAISAWSLNSVLVVSSTSLRALLLCAVVCASLLQQSLAADVNLNERQRIGLVLGGGGAKGAAHIGVLTVLEELRVPVDCIAGTSMGALVGGTYAAGMPADDLEAAARAINWSETLGKQGLRDRTPINKKLASRTYTNSLELGIKNGRITVPGGLLKTQDIDDTIRDLVNDARLQKDFDDLPIPFRAVATDMVRGEMVVLGSGDLSIAMRASMSIPGAFSPVIIGDKVLTDGGMMRNLPVDIARSLCADVVIAVWLSTPPPKAEELDNALALVGRSLGVMIDANEKAQIATLTEDDIGIDVPMGDIGTGDFQRVPDAIELGKVAAEKMAGELSRLAIPEEDYLAWREQITTVDSPKVQIAEVQIKGLQKVSPTYVEAQLENLKPPAEVSSEQISEDTDRIYATGDFKKVDYTITGPPGNKTIEIFPVEKPWGPNYLRFDFGLYAEGSGDLMAVLRGEHTRAWMNKKGGTWTNTVQLGRPTLLTSSIYQPIDETQRFFIRPTVSYDNSLENIYSDGQRVARYELRETYGELAFGANIGTRAQLTTGLRAGQLQTKRDIGILILPDEKKERDTSIFLTATYDTRDDIGLPTKGSLVYLRYVHADSWLGGETRYDLAEGVFTKSFPWRGDSLSLIVGAGGLINGILPPVRDFTLGGIRSFPGLRLDELRGVKYWFAGTSYLWKLADIQPLMGEALYAGLRLQAGEMRDRRDQVDEGTLYGISGSINGRTPIGPFVLSLGYVSNDSWELQFSLGRPLPEGSALDEIQ